jgi:NADH-quinone oxidoreductase subunit E
MRVLSGEAVAAIRGEMAKYPNPRSALMPALYIAQRAAGGWLSPEAMADVAAVMGLTAADVQGVASFYAMYYKEPVGRYVIDVCHNVSCSLLGGKELLRHLLARLGVEEGQVTPDGLFTVKGAECLAACGGAPCLQVNVEYHENVTLAQADMLLDRLRAEAGVTGDGDGGHAA